MVNSKLTIMDCGKRNQPLMIQTASRNETLSRTEYATAGQGKVLRKDSDRAVRKAERQAKRKDRERRREEKNSRRLKKAEKRKRRQLRRAQKREQKDADGSIPELHGGTDDKPTNKALLDLKVSTQQFIYSSRADFRVVFRA